MKVKSESEVAQSCPTLHDPMDGSLPGSSVHGIFQARVLEWGAIVCTIILIRTNHSSRTQILVQIMATHSSILGLENPRDGEPDGLLSMGSHRVRHN